MNKNFDSIIIYYLIEFTLRCKIFPNIHFCSCNASWWLCASFFLVLNYYFKEFLESEKVCSNKHHFTSSLRNHQKEISTVMSDEW